MVTKITPEQRVALQAHQPGVPVQVRDDQDQKVYWLLSPEDMPSLWQDYIRNEVDKGLSAVDRGEIVEWDPDKIKARLRDVAARHNVDP